MVTREQVGMVAKVTLLAAATLILFTLSMSVSGLTGDSPSDSTEPPALGIGLIAFCFAPPVTVAAIVRRARWTGWRLVIAVFTTIYGTMTVLAQIETAFFHEAVGADIAPQLFLAGALFAASFSPLAVWILGGIRPRSPGTKERSGTVVSWQGLLWRVLAVACLHVVIYFVVGYFVAWQSLTLRTYYGGADPGSFLLQLRHLAENDPWIYPLQLFRGMLWALLALLLVRMIAGPVLQVALVAVLVFAVLGPVQLLLPNPYMPSEVRMVHLWETCLSRLVFAVGAVALFRHELRP